MGIAVAMRAHFLSRLGFLFGVATLGLSGAAFAGPPFLTDDPEPTEHGHWEIYGPFVEAEGRGGDVSGATGVELNYGALADVQLTLELPMAYAREGGSTRAGMGDIAVSAKYRFLNNEAAGLQFAAFPGISLPTASRSLGAGHVTAFLPVWFQKENGSWTLFGGGGYALNPGIGNRNYWSGGIAVSRKFGERLLIGLEADREGADSIGGQGKTMLGLGAIYDLKGPLRLLGSAGPSFEDGIHGSGFHAFLALGIDY